MKSLWKILAVSLLVCCQVSLSQNAAYKSQVAAPQTTVPVQTPEGQVEILSNISGVNFGPYVSKIASITNRNWRKHMPGDANQPTLAKGEVQVQFEIEPNGKVNRKNIEVVLSSGNARLDHAGWEAVRKSKYPPIPKFFHRPYLTMRFVFLYNMPTPQPAAEGHPS